MTFFELIRNSLLADSAKKKPPGEIMRSVLAVWQEKTAPNHPVRSNKAPDSAPETQK